ncbi:MAG: hypothetical protein ACRD2F_10570 [Terriglobales bacterium]
MTPPEEAVEAALAGCERLGRSLRASPARVRAARSRDEVRGVARAWFGSQRGELAPFLGAEIGGADRLYQDLLEATGRSASRAGYLAILRELRAELLRIRSHPAVLIPGVAPAVAGVERPPNFSILTDDLAMQELLTRRWRECELCVEAGAPLAATVMMGGILEAVLLARLDQMPNRSPAYRAKAAPRDTAGKTRVLRDWKLQEFIMVAHELGWISPVARASAQVVRDFRSFVHPAKEHETGPAPSIDDAGILWEITKRLVRQLLGA